MASNGDTWSWAQIHWDGAYFINTSLQRVVQDNYETILSNVRSDLAKWSALPGSLRSRIAVVKMNIFPRVNFLSDDTPTSTSKFLEES